MSDPRLIVLVIALVGVMVTSVQIGRRSRLGPLVLALTSVTWLLVDTPFEGDVLLVVTPTHGLTGTDLVGVLGLLISAFQLWLLQRRR